MMRRHQEHRMLQKLVDGLALLRVQHKHLSDERQKGRCENAHIREHICGHRFRERREDLFLEIPPKRTWLCLFRDELQSRQTFGVVGECTAAAVRYASQSLEQTAAGTP